VDRRQHCGSGVPSGLEIQRHPHRVQHSHHAITDVMSDHCFDVVLAQKPGHSGVMPSRRSLIVQPAPRDLEHLPVLDLAVAHVGNRNLVGATPTGVDQSFTRYWNANIHVSRVSLLEILPWISTSVLPTPQRLTREFLAPKRVIENHSSSWIRRKAELHSLAIWCNEAWYAFVRRSLVKVSSRNVS
jgi:hypothetical protein